MNAISPFAPADMMRKPAKALAGAMSDAAGQAAKRAASVAGEAPGAARRASGFAQAAAGTVAQSLNSGPPATGPHIGQGRQGGIRAALIGAAAAQASDAPSPSGLRATLEDAVRTLSEKAPPLAGFATERAIQARHLLAAAAPALPAAPAVQADENLTSTDRVRAAYNAVQRMQ